MVQIFQLPAHVTATRASDICIRRHFGKQRARFALKKGNFHIRNVWCMRAQPENRDASRVCFAVCWYWPKVCLAGKKVPPDFIAPYSSKFAIELREKWATIWWGKMSHPLALYTQRINETWQGQDLPTYKSVLGLCLERERLGSRVSSIPAALALKSSCFLWGTSPLELLQPIRSLILNSLIKFNFQLI